MIHHEDEYSAGDQQMRRIGEGGGEHVVGNYEFMRSTSRSGAHIYLNRR